MPRTDRQFVDDLTRRLSALRPDTPPRWGRMTAPQMLAHCTHAVRYSLGKEGVSPREWNPFLQAIARPVVLSGLLSMPRNAKAPRIFEPGEGVADATALSIELNEFVDRCGQPGFAPPPHPYFGDLGASGWSRLHALHMDHHARQFGV
ncbi:MAG: DUF1569 domain-containing protein [Candidatus Hydrogenedentes bacterium]|nr:DUF1569 domain-containing protein [Candidatus Hydrogenedentota bacterium]